MSQQMVLAHRPPEGFFQQVSCYNLWKGHMPTHPNGKFLPSVDLP